METLITIVVETVVMILWPIIKAYLFLETLIIQAICHHKHIDKYDHYCISCGKQC